MQHNFELVKILPGFNLFDKFKKDLIEVKNELIKVLNEKLDRLTDTEKLDKELKELRDCINNNQLKAEEKFYEHQDNFININKMIENFQNAFYSCNVVFFFIKIIVQNEIIYLYFLA